MWCSVLLTISLHQTVTVNGLNTMLAIYPIMNCYCDNCRFTTFLSLESSREFHEIMVLMLTQLSSPQQEYLHTLYTRDNWPVTLSTCLGVAESGRQNLLTGWSVTPTIFCWCHFNNYSADILNMKKLKAHVRHATMWSNFVLTNTNSVPL